MFGLRGNQDKREMVYSNYFMKVDNGEILEGEDLSINSFYNNNSALCTERSAVVQNLLAFAGVNTNLVFGKLTVSGATEFHAYNIIETTTGVKILFDSTNPVLLKKDEKNFNALGFNVLNEAISLENDEVSSLEFDNNQVASAYQTILADDIQRTYSIPRFNKEKKTIKI